MSWSGLKDVSSRRLQDMSSRRLQEMFSRCLWDISSRRLEDVFSVTIFRFPRRFQDALWDVAFKTSWKRLAKSKVATLKTYWRRLLHMSSGRLQDVLKINKCLLGYVLRSPLQDVYKTSSKTSSKYLQDFLQKLLQDIFKTSQNVFKTVPRYL